LAAFVLGVAGYLAWIFSMVAGYVLGVSPVVPLAAVLALATGAMIAAVIRRH
jgi:hypothetical protein